MFIMSVLITNMVARWWGPITKCKCKKITASKIWIDTQFHCNRLVPAKRATNDIIFYIRIRNPTTKLWRMQDFPEAAPTNYLINFPRKLMKMKKFWAGRGGSTSLAPPRSANTKIIILLVTNHNLIVFIALCWMSQKVRLYFCYKSTVKKNTYSSVLLDVLFPALKKVKFSGMFCRKETRMNQCKLVSIVLTKKLNFLQ